MIKIFYKIYFYFYYKWFFFYKHILHKKRTKTIISNKFLIKLYQITEVIILISAIGLMLFIAKKFLRG
jgi:hypothetical protein